jgi:hypothetical protein
VALALIINSVLGVEVSIVNVIRLSSTADLGSLEDLNPEKRMTVADIRSLRRKAHAQTQIKFSIARAVANVVAFLKNNINQLLADRNSKSHCELQSRCLKTEDHNFTVV